MFARHAASCVRAERRELGDHPGIGPAHPALAPRLSARGWPASAFGAADPMLLGLNSSLQSPEELYGEPAPIATLAP